MRTGHNRMTITTNSQLIVITSMFIVAFTYGCSSQDVGIKASSGVPNSTNYDEQTKVKVNNIKSIGTQIVKSEEMITIDFMKCMNKEGVKTPYPELNSDGSVKWGILKTAIATQNAGFSWESKKSKKALEICLPILDAVASTSPEPKEDPVKLQDDLLKLVSCLRNHGYSVADPNFTKDPRAAMKPIYEQFKAKSSGTSISTKAERTFDLCNAAIFQNKKDK